jgi:hypothetical protein
MPKLRSPAIPDARSEEVTTRRADEDGTRQLLGSDLGKIDSSRQCGVAINEIDDAALATIDFDFTILIQIQSDRAIRRGDQQIIKSITIDVARVGQSQAGLIADFLADKDNAQFGIRITQFR